MGGLGFFVGYIVGVLTCFLLMLLPSDREGKR